MPQGGAQSWILVISELHRYQGVSYKSDIIVISGNSQQSILENICLDIIFHYKDKEINSVLMTLKAIFVQMKMAGLDTGDRQALEQKYSGCDPPCLLDSSDGRFVLKGAGYNPMDVINCLMARRGYRMQGAPQQRTLPNIHNKDDK